MRVTFNLSPNYRRLVPFNYQQSLVGRLHRWLGDNSLHDEISLYSVSWLGFNGVVRSGGLHFPHGTSFHISAASDDLMADVMEGLKKDTEVNWGMRVISIMPQGEPDFGTSARFLMQSPVLVKRNLDDGRTKFYVYTDEEADNLITETIHNKMRHAGIKGDIKLSFDRTFKNAKTKVASYRGIENKASFCPVLAEGDPNSIAFAWNVGIGNSTGIGFGAIK